MALNVETSQSITVDLKSFNALQTITFIQQDNNILTINVMDNGQPADLYDVAAVLVNLKRPDGTVFTHLLYATGNVVEYALTPDDMLLPGLCEAEIKFYSRVLDDKRISTRRFNINLLKELGSTEVEESSPQVTVLRELIDEVKQSSLTPVTRLITATTEGQTLFTFGDMEYLMGKGQVHVDVDGIKQHINEGFTETSPISITLAEGVPLGAEVLITVYEHETSTNTRFVTVDRAFEEVHAELATNKQLLKHKVSVLKYGAKGDGENDDTQAIRDADQYCYDNGLTLLFPPGVYKCTNGIVRKAEWVGSGTPTLGTFPLEDDKLLLRPGYKNKLRGTVLLFTGTGAAIATTQRVDEFISFTYCVKTLPKNTTGMTGIAIVQDMDAKDEAGEWTTTTTDNRAVYDVGYFVDDSPRNIHNDFVVFGYFAKAGIAMLSKEDTGYEGDPDYCSFSNGSVSGNIGVALLGSQTDNGVDSGLSGTRFHNFQIFSKDHHSRDNVVDDWGKAVVYIDGHTDAINDDINGHYFSQCGVRTYGNNPVILDQASNVSFSQTVFETPKRFTTNSAATQFKATDKTGDVHFLSCRFSDGAGLYTPEFSGVMAGKLIVVGDPYDDVLVAKGGKAVRMGAETVPFVQLTDDPASKVDGWVIQNDFANAINPESLEFRFNNATVFRINKNGGLMRFGLAFGGTKFIENGNITIDEYSYYAVDTEGAVATDNLATITGGAFDGQRLMLRASNASRDIVVVETGNIRLNTSTITLNHSQDRLELEWDGTNWIQVSFTDNSA